MWIKRLSWVNHHTFSSTKYTLPISPLPMTLILEKLSTVTGFLSPSIGDFERKGSTPSLDEVLEGFGETREAPEAVPPAHINAYYVIVKT